MALFQRLVSEEAIGFNYDFMGYAEFEYGAPRDARSEIASFWVNNKISAKKVEFTGTMGRMKTKFPAVIVGEKEYLDSLSSNFKSSVDKTGMREDNPKILGWMTVGSSHKVIIFRDDENLDANFKRLELFLKPAVEAANETADHREQS